MPANTPWYADYLYADEEGRIDLWDCSRCDEEHRIADFKPEAECDEGLLCADCDERHNEDDTPEIGFSLSVMLYGGTLFGGE